MSFLRLWNAFLVQQRQEKRLEEFRNLSTDELKALWDGFDGDAELNQPGYFWPDSGPHLEDVHLLLNERGEGSYCAV